MRYNKIAEAMEPGDYLVDESFVRTDNNCLLNYEGNGPNPGITAQSELALAAIAEAVHTNARYLTSEQTELAVKWLKTWKLAPGDSLSPIEAREAFAKKLESLKVSAEQVRLQRVANRYGIWARVWGATFAVILATIAVLGILGGANVLAWAAMVAGLIGSLVASEYSMVRALVTAKEQDRRYALQSLRVASNITELIDAGLCAYLSGSHYEDRHYSEQAAKAQMAAERDRLADALYSDPHDYLDAWSYRKS